MLTILSHEWTNSSGKQLINLNKHQQDKNTSFRSLTAPIISNHDAPYITDNLPTSKYEVRHKFIRKFKNLNLESYINDCKTLRCTAVCSFDDTEDKLDTLNKLIFTAIDKLRTKFTKPPATYMKEIEINHL